MAITELSNGATTVHKKHEFECEALDNVQPKEPGIIPPAQEMSRNIFPSDFVFGSATSAYQIEGGALEGGRGPSSWDTECETPGRILDGSTGNVSCDSYHRYEEDVDLMDSIGFDAYRFSIAWTRIFPEGVGEQPNEAGLDYYNRVIDKLLSKGIEPWVTLYHFDLPQALIDKYGGWFGREIVPAFAAYAEACFAAFGNRVKHWITLNEPTIDLALNSGFRGSKETSVAVNTPERRYVQGHNMLLAHAAAVKVYREKYQGSDGKIGISLDVQWYEPITNSPEDIEAAELAMTFRGGWLLDPLYFGQYPEVIYKTYGGSLPSFTDEERKVVKGSVDFLGINYYTAFYASAKPMDGFSNAPSFPVAYPSTIYVGDIRDGLPIGGVSGAGLNVLPGGLEKVLLMLGRQYGNPVTYVTENGYSEIREPGLSLGENLNDAVRTQFFRDHLCAVLAAYKKGADIRGYFAWSLLDNFEWSWGYKFKFGLLYVDFEDGQKRYMKASALWFKQFLQQKPSKNQTRPNRNHV